jgi:hypothetical protein
MRKILNPFSPLWREEYNCIGCSPQNEIGFHLQFYDNGDELIAGWIPEKNFMGYPDVVHGGIQSTLLDEIGGWAVYVILIEAAIKRFNYPGLKAFYEEE